MKTQSNKQAVSAKIIIALVFALLIAGSGPIFTGLVLADESPVETIEFAPEALVGSQPIQVTLSSQAAGTIHYTTNGAAPDINSAVYSQTLPISQSTVIRAQLFGPDGQPVGPLYTRSYLIADYSQTIPVISLTGSWDDLDALHNHPAEHGKEWERPINMEFFETDGQSAFNVAAGIRIHGGKSRLMSPKKSYRIYFRQSYGGPGNLEYPLFEDSPVTKFDKLVLRAGFNDSFTYVNSDGMAKEGAFAAKYIGDQVTRNLHRDMGQPIAHGRWVVVYFNGQYWGLYNLTERIDLQYFRAYSEKNSDWDVIGKETEDENGEWLPREIPIDGGDGAWLENQAWVGSADFTNPGNIGLLEWRVDMENLFSYMFLQAYIQNYDWPGHNWIVYRRYDPGAVGNEAKWRLIIWDAEFSFGSGSHGFIADMNTLEKVYSPHDSITRLLEKPFIGNCAIKHRFVERAREYLGVENKYGKPDDQVGQLSKERVKAEIIKQADIVRPYIPMEIQRWAPSMPPTLFEQNIQNSLKFVDEREEVILHHLDELRYQMFTTCR